jgi:diguanylate cyclase (GGDEF)-like protein
MYLENLIFVLSLLFIFVVFLFSNRKDRKHRKVLVAGLESYRLKSKISNEVAFLSSIVLRIKQISLKSIEEEAGIDPVEQEIVQILKGITDLPIRIVVTVNSFNILLDTANIESSLVDQEEMLFIEDEAFRVTVYAPREVEQDYRLLTILLTIANAVEGSSRDFYRIAVEAKKIKGEAFFADLRSKIHRIPFDSLEVEILEVIKSVTDEPVRVEVYTPGMVLVDTGAFPGKQKLIELEPMGQKSTKVRTRIWVREELEDENPHVFACLEVVAMAIEDVAENYCIASTDQQTSLYNYREISRRIDEEVPRAKAKNHPLSIILLDLDNFKKVNDRYGYEAGNQVLSKAARILSEHTKAFDTVGRLALGRFTSNRGDEFIVILPETDQDAAASVAERLREAIEENTFLVERLNENEKRKEIHLTASFGVATLPNVADDGDALIRKANSVLKYSKSHGRNRVSVARRKSWDRGKQVA